MTSKIDTSIPLGFIGTGVMGHSMAMHLLKAGYALRVYNRSREKAEALVEAGAAWCDTPGEVAARSEIIFSIVGFPQDVEAIYLGPDGILERASSGSVCVDLTTSSPQLAVQLAEQGKVKGVQVLDAPVSGGDKGAREGTLSIMVGGDRETYQRVLPLLQTMGKNIVYQGGPGSGQHTKMANQIAIASTMMGVCEALAYAKHAGLDPEQVLASISKGAAGSWTMDVLAPRILEGDFEAGFYVKHFIKDMGIAAESASQMHLDTPGLKQSLELYRHIAQQGMEDKGTQALFQYYSRATNQ